MEEQNVNVADYVTRLYGEFKDNDNLKLVFKYFLGQANDYQLVADSLKKTAFKGYESEILRQAYLDTIEMFSLKQAEPISKWRKAYSPR